jgi:hypothetical protein
MVTDSGVLILVVCLIFSMAGLLASRGVLYKAALTQDRPVQTILLCIGIVSSMFFLLSTYLWFMEASNMIDDRRPLAGTPKEYLQALPKLDVNKVP